jgi:putative spermidine/putrescine transport system permease protein
MGELGGGRLLYRAFLLPGLLFVAVFYLLPLGAIAWLSIGDPAPGVQNYEWLGGSSAARQILWTTLRISVVTAALSVVLGYLVAYVVWLSEGAMKHLLLGTVLVAFWLSVLVRCFALVMVLRPGGMIQVALSALLPGDTPLRLVRNETGVLIGMVHYLLPYAALTILAALQSIERRLIDAARSMGASRTAIFRRIVLPLSATGVGAAAALTFILALGFYITPAILGGGRVVMIAEFITYHVQDILAWGKASALAVLLVGIIGIGWIAVSRIQRTLPARS